MKNIKQALEVTTNVSIVVVCMLFGFSYLTHRSLAFNVSQPRAAAAASLKGASVAAIPGYKWNEHAKTLVLGIRTGCHFCSNSLPFYKRLSDLEKANSLGAHLLAVMPDDRNASDNFFRAKAVQVERIAGQPLNEIHVTSTPTILLVDSAGKIANAWVGELPANEEDALIASLKK
jgi:hypothetical protein